MPKKINTFSNQRQHTQRVDLEGTIYQIRLTWRRRPQAWYMDLFDRDGAPIAIGRKLTPAWSPTATSSSSDLPPGLFLVVGPDGYTRDDLGEDLRLYYFSESDLEALESAPDPIPEVVVT